jgi:hypothetical protein
MDPYNTDAKPSVPKAGATGLEPCPYTALGFGRSHTTGHSDHNLEHTPDPQSDARFGAALGALVNKYAVSFVC